MHQQSDSITWGHDPEGIYNQVSLSTASIKRSACPSSPSPTPHLLRMPLAPKIKMFLWFVAIMFFQSVLRFPKEILLLHLIVIFVMIKKKTGNIFSFTVRLGPIFATIGTAFTKSWSAYPSLPASGYKELKSFSSDFYYHCFMVHSETQKWGNLHYQSSMSSSSS